jgi:hypothetical protein
MPHWNLHLRRRTPEDQTAHQVQRAARWLNDRTKAVAGRAPITSDMAADLAVMARRGDLTQVIVDGCQNGTTVATWSVRLTRYGFVPRAPASLPDVALRFRVVPVRLGREHLYRHLLRCSWTAAVSRR